MWTEDQLGPRAENGCPVTLKAIEGYLHACSFHYLRDFEPPLEFGSLTLALVRPAHGREFWIFTCTDGIGRPWFVCASEGSDEPRRWVLAESNEDDLSVEEFFDYAVADWRSAEGSIT